MTAWSAWRGPGRDGRVAWLPDRLPEALPVVWSIETSGRTLGGSAATADRVIFSDRILDDTTDCWKCVSAADGKELWSYTYVAKGNLDYGNSPRTTPLIDGDRVYVFGAFGHLACLDLKTGTAEWEMNLREEFESKDEPKWGACSSPLLVDGKLIVNPGTKEVSLAALDPKKGKILWKSPGRAAGYGSLTVGTFGGRKQIVGHDAETLGGWDPTDGKRLWTLKPENPNDFNVPTPIPHKDRLIVTTENNGTRIYRFGADGVIDPKPAAVHRKLAPDTHTPVLVGNRLFGVWRRLYCLDVENKLAAVWDQDGGSFTRYAAAVATDRRVLVIGMEGEFILVDAIADEYTELGRTKPLAGEKGLYSHPAFVGTRCFVRTGSTMQCLELK